MNRNHLIFCLVLSTFFLGSDRFAAAQRYSIDGQRVENRVSGNPRAKTEFLRLTKDDAGIPESLQTAITRYRSADGKLLVDLIGVIHIGESNYYRKLNHQFEQYDALLYELVAAKQNRVPDLKTRSSGSNPLHWLQNSMQNMLGLESQLKHIDYKKSNFVHADLSPTEMQQKMAERGDTAWSLGLRALSEVMQQQSQQQSNEALTLGEEVSSLEDLFAMIQDPVRLKTMLATQFAAGGALDAGLGASLNELLITDRNQAAMKVLKREIENGQTKIGIFYGAAHMPDFEKRLLAELGLKKTKQAWARAWDLKSAPRRSSSENGMAEMFFQLLESLDQ